MEDPAKDAARIQVDRELGALTQIIGAMEPLTVEARARVFAAVLCLGDADIAQAAVAVWHRRHR